MRQPDVSQETRKPTICQNEVRWERILPIRCDPCTCGPCDCGKDAACRGCARRGWFYPDPPAWWVEEMPQGPNVHMTVHTPWRSVCRWIWDLLGVLPMEPGTLNLMGPWHTPDAGDLLDEPVEEE